MNTNEIALNLFFIIFKFNNSPTLFKVFGNPLEIILRALIIFQYKDTTTTLTKTHQIVPKRTKTHHIKLFLI